MEAQTEARASSGSTVQSQSDLLALYEAMPAGLCHFDREFRFVRVNPALARMNGLPIAAHLGRTPFELLPEVAAQAEETFREVLESGRPRRIEVHGRTPAHPFEERFWDEHWYPVRDDSGQVVSVGAIVIDITERKRAERELAEAERRFRASQEASPIAFTILKSVRDAGGRIVDFEWEYVNQSASQVLKRAARDLVGKRLLVELPGNAQSSELFATYCRVVETGISSDREFRYEADGITGCFHNIAVKLDDGVAVSFSDVTEQVRTREALGQAKLAAEKASAAKDRFLAVLSHELRTPLTPAVIGIESMLMEADLPPALREPLEMVQRNVGLEIKLIDDLLDLSRVVSGKLRLDFKPVDINKAVRETCHTCEQAANEKGIRVRCELDASCRRVHADPARLQQILWNLLRNAVKFTPEGGDVLITTHSVGDSVCVRVRDTGIGISGTVLDRIFEAFEQGHADAGTSFGGMGLGLAITKSLVELHRGEVMAESAGPGQGATFTIKLPALAAASGGGGATSHDAPGDCSGLRVLIVEDHLETAKVLTRSLGKRTRHVRAAHSVAEAFQACAEEPFDVVISDIGLPDGTGYSLMREVAARHRIPGIAMSGYGMAEDLQRSREAGFVEHLVKPVRITQLIGALQRVHEAGSEKR